MTFEKEHLIKCIRGIELYNAEQFWDCHEELEDPWLEDQGSPVRLIYWAIIQVATALFHYHQQNLAGAQGMLSKAKDKFKQAEQKGVESEIVFKFLGWKRFKKLVFAIKDKPDLEDFAELSRFKFSDPKKWGPHL